MAASHRRALAVACALIASLLRPPVADAATPVVGDRKALLLLPIASGTPGQEWAAKALGGILEDGFGSLRSVRLVAGTARTVALRELAASATATPEVFRDICRRAGADLAVLGGSTLVAGQLALELRAFDVGAGKELLTFHGSEPVAGAFSLVGGAIGHVAAQAGFAVTEPLFPRGVTVSLEAYAAYRAALLEEAPAARVEKLRGVLRLDANYADPARRLGIELFRQGSLDEALVVLERAVALDPKVAEARNNYGVALAAAGRAEPAQREFEEAVSLAPDYAEARLNLARVLEDRGSLSNAEKQYAAILEADAGNDKARAGIAALYDRTGRPELAVKEFRQLSARRPDLAEGEFIRIGQEARKAREYARAEKFFLRATDVNPQFAPGWAELGTNSYLAGEYPKGVEYFRKALMIDPGQAAYHYYLALALDKGRQQDEALREYRRAVELGGPPEARLGLARAALESGDPGLAVEELNRVLVASPENAEAKVLLAQATGEMEARRRLVEGQSQFANQRLARLEQIVADANRANRELEARLQAVTQEKRLLAEVGARERGTVQAEAASPPAAAGPAPAVPPAAGKGPAPASGGPAADETARGATRAGELGRDVERLRGELATERDARRREGAEAQAALALLRAEKDRLGRELAEERERLKHGAERAQEDLAAAQAKILELGRGSGEVVELRLRLASLQADLARAQTGLAQEREAHRAENERLKAELAASGVARAELAKQATEASELKGRLQAVEGGVAKAEEAQRAERARGESAVAAERETRRVETERIKAELAASEAACETARGKLATLANEAASLNVQLLAAQGALSRAEDAQRAERERGEQLLAAERADRRAEVEKLRAELAAGQFKRQEKERLLQELAAEKSRAAAAQAGRVKSESAQAAEREARAADIEKLRVELAAAQVRRQDRDRLTQELAGERERARREQGGREKAEQALAGEREQAAKAMAAERASRQSEVDRLKAEAAGSLGCAQDRDRLTQELAAVRALVLTEQAGREKAERAVAAERERGEQAVAGEREESRRLATQNAVRVGALETQLKTQTETLLAREAELAAARDQQAAFAAQLAKGRADLELLAERKVALEARAAEVSRTLAERDSALEKARLAVRDLALELGRSALRTQSWEKARGYLEQASEVDPRSGEAWYGLGEALFQLGQYEKSKQMYDKAKQIY